MVTLSVTSSGLNITAQDKKLQYTYIQMLILQLKAV